MSGSNLPAPRRIITGHKADGSSAVVDEEVPVKMVPGNFGVSQAFAIDSFEPDPIKAFEGKDMKVNGMFVPGGVSMRWVGTSLSVH